MNRPVILCGLGRVGWRVLMTLRATGAAVTVVDLHARENDPRLAGVTFFRGDCRQQEVLEKAGIGSAGGVLVVTGDDLVNVATALLVRRLNGTARIVIRMFNQGLITRLGPAIKNTVALSVSALTAPLIALAAVSADSLAAVTVNAAPQQLVDLSIAADSPFVGEKIGTVAATLKVLVVAHVPAGADPILVNEVSGGAILQAGDRLVVCGGPTELEVVAGRAQTSSGRWRAILRPLLRTIRRTVAAIDTPVKIATGVLFVTLLASTLVFRFGGGDSWADSFFQTVSVTATGGDLPGADRTEWVKVYIAGLKMIGAALIAAFTAIFTNYLLRLRLGGALEERRIPEHGHVVVCGLGNVGFRTILEVQKLGPKVVAIEMNGDSPMVATVRRMGVAVVIGDATVPEVLKQARVDTARAVIAVTSNELANLGIALLVREQNPAQRVVVRITDPDFAQAARDAADIRNAISPPAVASTAFVTALVGDQVQAMAAVGTKLLAVVDLVVHADDATLAGRSLHELMIDHRFLPLGVSGREPFATTGIPKTLRLTANDRLTVAISHGELETLLRRVPPPADWSVTVREVPLSATSELIPLILSARGCTHDDAKKLLEAKTFTLTERVSRGQAEELVARLAREKVQATAEQIGRVSQP